MEIQKGTFADGIRMLNTKGALVKPVRLTKARGRMLLQYIDEFKHRWYCDHPTADKEMEDEMQFTMQWILNQVNKRWSQNELYSESDVRRQKKK